MTGVDTQGPPWFAPPVGPPAPLAPPVGAPAPLAPPAASIPAATAPFEPAAPPPTAVRASRGDRRAVRAAARSRRRLERPAPVKHPRDWRWYVGGLGRILISLGLLIFAFVAYQLWGTGIQHAQHQNKLKSEFEALLARAPAPLPPPSAVITLVPGSPAAAPTTVPATGDSQPATSTPPTTDPLVVAPDPVAAPALPAIGLGDPIAFLEIPSIGVREVIVAGVRTEDLQKGVGHFPASPMPGQPGNAALAGHRTTNGQPFINIDKVKPGDEIIVTTLQGRYVYRMTGQQVVKPSDGQVVANQPDKKMLTLTSCTPKYSAKQRIVVTADLDETASSPLGAPTSNYVDPSAPAAVAAVEAPLDSLPAEGAPPSTTPDGAPATTPNGGAPVDTIVESGEAPVTTAPVDGGDDDAASAGFDESVDALSAGWFSDPDAWPQVAVWGSILSIVALLAWRLSVRVRRNWVGVLVGFGPFVVVLYFFFENVNRLLPPNL